MGSKSKAPKAPNYQALAQQQAELARQQWQRELTAARPDQKNPFGSLTWEQDPTTGEWTQNVSLAPDYEQLRQGQVGQQQQIGDLIAGNLGSFDASQIDLSQAGAMPEVGGYDQRAIDTIRALQAPDLERRRNAAQTRMAAMGLSDPGAAASQAMQQSIGDAESRADMNAILEGLRRGDTMFGQGMDIYKTKVNDILRERAANLGQTQGLFGLQSPVQAPQFAGFNNVSAGAGATPNLVGAAQAQYQADAARKQSGGSALGGLAGLAGTVVGGFFGGPPGAAAGGAVGGGGGKGNKSAATPAYSGWESNAFNGTGYGMNF